MEFVFTVQTFCISTFCFVYLKMIKYTLNLKFPTYYEARYTFQYWSVTLKHDTWRLHALSKTLLCYHTFFAATATLILTVTSINRLCNRQKNSLDKKFRLHSGDFIICYLMFTKSFTFISISFQRCLIMLRICCHSSKYVHVEGQLKDKAYME